MNMHTSLRPGLVTLAVLLGLLLFPAAGPAKNKIEAHSLEHEGTQHTYYLYVPEGITEGSPAPLLVLFHGSGREGDVLLKEWRKLADQEKIILAGPEARNPQNWEIPADGPDPIHALVEALRGELPIDPHRLYLFGHSAGANFALVLSMIESGYFTATAVHAGAFQPSTGEPWISYVDRKIPMFLVVGTRDRFFPLRRVRTSRDALQEAGVPVELWEIQGHDHDYYGRSKKINARVWEFLSQHRLEDEPSYQRYAN